MAAHFTRRYRIRLMRWMMIGADTSSPPATMVHGFRKASNIRAQTPPAKPEVRKPEVRGRRNSIRLPRRVSVRTAEPRGPAVG